MTVGGTLLILLGFFGINLAGGKAEAGCDIAGVETKSKTSDQDAEENLGLLRPIDRMTEEGQGGRTGKSSDE